VQHLCSLITVATAVTVTVTVPVPASGAPTSASTTLTTLTTLTTPATLASAMGCGCFCSTGLSAWNALQKGAARVAVDTFEIRIPVGGGQRRPSGGHRRPPAGAEIHRPADVVVEAPLLRLAGQAVRRQATVPVYRAVHAGLQGDGLVEAVCRTERLVEPMA
jgi:hypothetical protein